MKRISAILLVVVAGCSGEQPEQQPNDLAANVDSQPVSTPENGTAPIPANSTVAEVKPPPPHIDPGAPPPRPDKSAVGAARRLQEYCDAIATKRFRDAFGYWGNDGEASGLSFAQFRDSFTRFADYNCHIGPPGRIEGAAGSVYVTIPFQVTGALVNGDGFLLEGPITMRRVNDVDGSTAEQRQWHIESSGLKPRPN